MSVGGWGNFVNVVSIARELVYHFELGVNRVVPGTKATGYHGEKKVSRGVGAMLVSFSPDCGISSSYLAAVQ
jgi:hypothetical protein